MTHVPIPIICGRTLRGSFLSELSFLDRMIYYDSIKVYDVSKHISLPMFSSKNGSIRRLNSKCHVLSVFLYGYPRLMK